MSNGWPPSVSAAPSGAGAAPSTSHSQAGGRALEALETGDDMPVVLGAHPVVQRQGHGLAVAVARDGKVVGREAEPIPVEPEHVHGVSAGPGAHAGLVERIHDLVARPGRLALVDVAYVRLPPVRVAGRNARGAQPGNARELRGVVVGPALALADVAVEFGELHQPDRALQV